MDNRSVDIPSAYELEVYFKANKKRIQSINDIEMAETVSLGALSSKLAIFYTKWKDYKFLNAPFVVVKR